MSLPRIRWSKDGTTFYFIDSNNVPTLQSSTVREKLDNVDLSAESAINYPWMYTNHLVMNFPDILKLDKIKMKISQRRIRLTIYTSADSTNGVDGTWTNQGSYDVSVDTLSEFLLPTLPNVRWLKLSAYCIDGGFSDTTVNIIQVYGEYQDPRYEMWLGDESRKVNVDGDIDFTPCPNTANASKSKTIKIKNLDSSSHQYKVEVYAVKYGGDTIISNNCKVSLDGETKLSSVTTATVSAGGFSELVYIHFDLLAANNPADGWHYFEVRITEV